MGLAFIRKRLGREHKEKLSRRSWGSFGLTKHHSSTLAWKIPWMEEPGRLQSMGSQRVGHDWATSLSLFTFMHWRRKWQPTPVFLPGESQGWGSLVGCRLWGRTVGHDWSDLAAAAAAAREQLINYCFKKINNTHRVQNGFEELNEAMISS